MQLGPYRVLAELGAGGMGKVYRAEVTLASSLSPDQPAREGTAAPLPEGSTVALKVIHAHLLESPSSLQRFRREAEIGQAIRHPNVVHTYATGTDQQEGRDVHYLVMEYVEGQTLRSLQEELACVPEELCRHIGREVAKGLEAIHAVSAIHRDLKPENVLITPDQVVKVMDLGVARMIDETMGLSQTGSFVGSLRYAAPEQFSRGRTDLDGRVDLHALGLVLYELSSGSHPYPDGGDIHSFINLILNVEPRRVAERNPQLSPFFEEVVHTLLAKPREDRFSTATELLEVLQSGEHSRWWGERAQKIRIETRRPLRRIRIPRETALYGREEEIAKLRALYESARSGEGRVVLVEGEAGIGKTRLVDELVGVLQQEGEEVNFLFGGFPPGGAATAAGAFSTAYREHFGEEGLEAALEEVLASVPLLLPAFAALLRSDALPSDAVPLTKESLQTAFVCCTQALAKERPTVVLIDDLHFAPEEGLALFTALAMAVPGHRILLVGTTRPGPVEAWSAELDRLTQTSRLSLPRLGPEHLAKLLVDALGSEPLAQDLGAQIVQRSDGNPYFVFEILRGLRDGQFLAKRDDGSWMKTGEIPAIQIPNSVRELIQARFSVLEEEDKDLLELAACCGFEFDPLLVGAALGMGRIPLLKHLGRLEKQHRLVRSVGVRYVFDHHQVQEALYSGLSELLRREYHLLLALAMETREEAAEKDPATLEGGLVVDLCRHFLEAAQGKRALRYLDPALNHLEGGYRNEAAVGLADRALGEDGLLEGRTRIEVLVRKSGRLELLGRPQEERSSLEEALALAETASEPLMRARILRSLGRHFTRVARYDEAIAILSQALDLATKEEDPKEEMVATGSLGTVFWALGRFEEARERYARHRALAHDLGDRSEEATATGNLGNVIFALGRHEEARGYYERHLALAREMNDRRAEAIATGNLGNVLFALGHREEARADYERHVALAHESGDRRSEAMVAGNLGNVLFELGRYVEARKHHERSLALAREMGLRRGEATALRNLGNVFLALGRTAEAVSSHEKSLALAQEIGHREGEATSLLNMGPLYALLGELERAREALEAGRELSATIGARRFVGYALHGLGELAEQERDGAAAERLFNGAITLRREYGDRSGLAGSLAALGGLLVDQGREDEARVALGEALALATETHAPGASVLAAAQLALLPGGEVSSALEIFESSKGRLDHRQTMKAQFLIWKATRNPFHLGEAHDLLQRLRESAPTESVEALLKRVPLHREIQLAWEADGTIGAETLPSD